MSEGEGGGGGGGGGDGWRGQSIPTGMAALTISVDFHSRFVCFCHFQCSWQCMQLLRY